MTSRKAALSGRFLLLAETLAESLRQRDRIGSASTCRRPAEAGVHAAASLHEGLSPGRQTDLTFARFDGEDVDRGDHERARSRTEPKS